MILLVSWLSRLLSGDQRDPAGNRVIRKHELHSRVAHVASGHLEIILDDFDGDAISEQAWNDHWQSKSPNVAEYNLKRIKMLMHRSISANKPAAPVNVSVAPSELEILQEKVFNGLDPDAQAVQSVSVHKLEQQRASPDIVNLLISVDKFMLPRSPRLGGRPTVSLLSWKKYWNDYERKHPGQSLAMLTNLEQVSHRKEVDLLIDEVFDEVDEDGDGSLAFSSENLLSLIQFGMAEPIQNSVDEKGHFEEVRKNADQLVSWLAQMDGKDGDAKINREQFRCHSLQSCA